FLAFFSLAFCLGFRFVAFFIRASRNPWLQVRPLSSHHQPAFPPARWFLQSCSPQQKSRPEGRLAHRVTGLMASPAKLGNSASVLQHRIDFIDDGGDLYQPLGLGLYGLLGGLKVSHVALRLGVEFGTAGLEFVGHRPAHNTTQHLSLVAPLIRYTTFKTDWPLPAVAFVVTAPG